MGLLSNLSQLARSPQLAAPFDNVDGLPFGQVELLVSLHDDRVVFQMPGSESVAFVEYERISSVSYSEEVDITTHEVDKNPIVRSIIGKAIAGRQGAMIGAITGIGTKVVERKEKYGLLSISYTDSSGDPAVISLRDSNLATGKGRRLTQVLRQLSGQECGPREIRL